MATAKGKIPFNKDISEDVFALFESICEELGPPKYRILEAAIEVFALLPIEMKYVLKSYKKEDRQRCFDLIRGIKSQKRVIAESNGAEPLPMPPAGNRVQRIGELLEEFRNLTLSEEVPESKVSAKKGVKKVAGH